ncbi:universal stress protein [Halolamina salifodinae]|uniref:Nucleotide-binding universal stress UspA family protein n=1 Tax=Halolamina salifodinae TaxID=1202767 RepID=A0A8T4GXF5_9EURY|nr:universal stress protein [Halolamina salifodinae]MBP1986304.1 nucleotide-binding universal stress UspA family protein [Halolamina salifodinae]
MFDTIVIATDGSESVQRAVDVALDFADRFDGPESRSDSVANQNASRSGDADVHALFVVDEREVESSPGSVREELRAALENDGEDAVASVAARAESAVTTAVREGRPAATISDYAREVDADVVATGTRGRHGENRYLIGGVAESVVRRCPVPVLTVRQLEGETDGEEATA